jgi:hypothetical protein
MGYNKIETVHNRSFACLAEKNETRKTHLGILSAYCVLSKLPVC